MAYSEKQDVDGESGTDARRSLSSSSVASAVFPVNPLLLPAYTTQENEICETHPEIPVVRVDQNRMLYPLGQGSQERYFVPPHRESDPLLPPPYYGQHQPTHVVVATKASFSPQCLYCPMCDEDVITSIKHKPGVFAWTSAVLCCFFGCFPFCCLPLFIDGCQDVLHRCPKCETVLAERSRLS
eukprot:CFRG8680